MFEIIEKIYTKILLNNYLQTIFFNISIKRKQNQY